MTVSPLRQYSIKRNGSSLVELLLVIAIAAALIGLLLCAVQKARNAAEHTRTINQLRQLAIAQQNYEFQQARLYSLGVEDPNKLNSPGVCPIFGLFNFLDGEPTWEQETASRIPWRTAVCSRADSSLIALRNVYDPNRSLTFCPTSFSFNMTAFAGRPHINDVDIPDGASTTIAYATKYAYYPNYHDTKANWILRYRMMMPPLIGSEIEGVRRCSFADVAWNDPIPITTGSPPISNSSVPGMTFQSGVGPSEADLHLPHGFHTGGLDVSMFDGSARTLTRSTSPELYWGMITRNCGESISD